MQDTDIQIWRPGILRNTDYLNPGPAKLLAATLDKDIENFKEGAILPELWHWLYFLPADRQSDLSVDGHPIKGHFLPPVDLPRRMWASSQMTWNSSFLLGEKVEKTSRVKEILEKRGSSGKLVFVNVEHLYRSNERDIMTEVHTIVYCEAVTSHKKHKKKASYDVPQEQFSHKIKPDPPLLFRYSALTFNTHRIHYDLDYVRNEEGYPGLVVQGPLTATLLVDLLKNNRPDVTIRNLQFRAISPLFSSDPIRLCGRVDGDVATLWAAGPDNYISMKATVLVY
ncbi:MaoC family dehydratase N-terminal domain-containing protein [Salmonella enterica]|uniref:Acyl-CoA dehydrogenase n=1 Tax=Salmonella enterica TaxID=28901 RepID=A0A634F8P9_SALER|nr:acyl-CoA dehydrogenase [Salmonella enterica]EDH4585334.1 acyl-CoA dehydrogenase [Salmonella enterica]EFV4426221.1 acyl-CoA dehydrogenase [Salmonella enterica]EFV4611557.1 acyl-CoA dehydrogenase [Salmonella enterica]EJJ9679150.1 MaoC family dehydratase N-terminal domain-containing protein [Salmonella enterica]